MGQERKFCWSLHYNGVNSYIFEIEIYKLKAKDPEINVAPFCLGNVSKKNVQLIIWKRLDYMDM